MRKGAASRRCRHLSVTGALLALAVVAGCGTSGPGSGGGAVRVWALEDQATNQVVEASMERFNEANENTNVKLSTYVNEPYKQKLQVSMGSPNAPDVFFNWGGGNLAQYVDAGAVYNMDDYLAEHPEFRDSFVPSVLDVAKIDGDIYGLPMKGVQPVILFYNKNVFEQAGASPPETYKDLLTLIDKFKAEGITPIALAGSQAWTELMWLEYLVDRIGGSEPFQAIVDGEDGAWSDPAIIEALEMCQELVRRGAFGSNYASITYDNASSSTLVAQGKAAMQLMGTWDMATQMESNPDFVESGAMGWTEFPTVAGGEGDPHSIVGNPSNYFSVAADDKTGTAMDYLRSSLASEKYVNGLIESGQVPAVKGIEDRLKGTENAEYTLFNYNLVQQAPTFTQSWDQALSPSVAQEMLTNLQQVFLLESTPEQFAKAMEKAE